MRRFLAAIILLVVGVLLVVFLVANRQDTVLSMDPFSPEDPAFAVGPLPLSLVMLIPLFIGFLLGCFGGWLSGGKKRAALREQRRENRRLREELKEARGLVAANDGGELVPLAGPGETPTGLPAVRA